MSDKAKWMLPPAIKNGLIMLAAGFAASLLCAKVFAAPLPAEVPALPTLVASAPATQSDDAAAAAALRAFIASRTMFASIVPADERRP